MDENKQDIEILHSRVDYTNVEVEQIGELQEKVEVTKYIILHFAAQTNLTLIAVESIRITHFIAVQ